MNSTAPRRTPTQRRSQERLERILRAAGELCDELGVAAVTMDAIAERAGTSIGSLYQFFPNRDALLQHIAERNVRELNALLDASDDPGVARLPLPELVEAVLAPFVDFHLTHPGYFNILFAPQGSEALRSLRGRLRKRLRLRVELLCRVRAPHIPAIHRRRMALTVVEASRALMQYIEQGIPAEERAAQRAELVTMLVAYLDPWLGGVAAAPADRRPDGSPQRGHR